MILFQLQTGFKIRDQLDMASAESAVEAAALSTAVQVATLPLVRRAESNSFTDCSTLATGSESQHHHHPFF